MNQTKFQIGDHVALKTSSDVPEQVLIITKIRSNARGENEYQLAHPSKNDPLINHDWFNEENLALAEVNLK